MMVQISALVSVIVPVYCAEKYLKECVESILSQTYENIELLLIDDGSTDSSPSICDAYAAENNRVHVFHKENGGVSSARNLGLEQARGEYVVFVDSDDKAYPTLIERLLSCAAPDRIVLCNYSVMDEKGMRLQAGERLENQENCEISEIISNILLNRTMLGSVWRTLFPADLLRRRKITFPPCRFSEDQVFLFHVLSHCAGVTILREELYQYRVHHDSATGQRYFKDFPKDREQYYLSLKPVLQDLGLEEQLMRKIRAAVILNERRRLFSNASKAPFPEQEYKTIKQGALFREKVSVFQKISWLSRLSKTDLAVAVCMELHLLRLLRWIRVHRKKTAQNAA